MNFFDDLTKLESKEETKEEVKETPKEESKEEPEEEPKEEPKENNSYTELQAQITELKELLTKLTNKEDINNDN